MKLLLHIGRPKTGTTSLQQFLYLNRDRLSDAGFYLFDGLGSPNNIELPAHLAGNLTSLKGWSQRRGITTMEEKNSYFSTRGFVDYFDEQIKNKSTSHHTAIITSEHLSSVLGREEDIQFCASFLSKRFEEVQVICFFRDQVDLLPSSWSMAIKAGSAISLGGAVKRSLTNQSLNYMSFADKWSKAFGRENLDCFVYEPAGTWDVRQEFSDKYLGGIDGLTLPSSRANTALEAAQANAARLINILIPYWLPGATKPNPKNLEARRRLLRVLAGKSGPPRLSASQTRIIRETFLESNAEFSRAYLPKGQSLPRSTSP